MTEEKDIRDNGETAVLTGSLTADALTNSIESKILTIRGHQVMLDRDLARLYQVETGRLNEQVKRNIKRFPADFMFQLSSEEAENLISQNAMSSWGGNR